MEENHEQKHIPNAEITTTTPYIDSDASLPVTRQGPFSGFGLLLHPVGKCVSVLHQHRSARSGSTRSSVRLALLADIVPTSYILCALHKHEPFDMALEQMKADRRARTATIQTGHTGVLTDPNETINALISFA